MADPKKYHLQVTAGPSYDPSTHKLVPVNTADSIEIDSELLSARLNVRIQNYRGLPNKSPESSPYFDHALHASSLYSISFTFTPKHDINGDEIVFGNDFEHPIRDSLPPGFGTALRIVRWAIDPGLDGDVYADHPYLYGPLLSSINVLRIGNGKEDEEHDVTQQASSVADDDEEPSEEKEQDELEANQVRQQHDASETHETVLSPSEVLTEGGTPPGQAIRSSAHIPDDSAARMKHFLTASHRQAFTFEQGRQYGCDFFNPYLDFNDLSLKLPGISLQLMRFWDGQPLRYTLKQRKSGGGGHNDKPGSTDKELLVIVFTLLPEEEAEAAEKKWSQVDGAAAAAPATHRPIDQTGPGGGAGGERSEANMDDID